MAGGRIGRARDWVDRQDPSTRSGTAIDAWQRYRAVDGPLQSALLSLYFLVAVIPALLVVESHLERNPSALADHVVHHFGLSRQSSKLIHGVLAGDHAHPLGSALLAIASALFFGLGFGKVLQLVHARAWGLTLQSKATDQLRFAAVLAGIYLLVLLLLLQVNQLGSSSLEWVLGVAWVGVLVVFFDWAPHLLTRGQLSRRDLLPGAVVTALGLVVVMVVSSFVMERWLDLYARDYGGFGVVMAIYFWLAFSSAVIVWAAAISPALARRRALVGSRS
jgi:membrane protein